MASVSPLLTWEAATMSVRLPERLAAVTFLLKITSEKALVQKGESEGLSFQRSLISNTAGFLPEWTIVLCPAHSLRTVMPSRRSSKP